ncbi:MAG: hypothetical protein HY657_16320 [Acidobacteria bacterium]|nr:hypothetical protein [Acidobacteriota bacterium]
MKTYRIFACATILAIAAVGCTAASDDVDDAEPIALEATGGGDAAGAAPAATPDAADQARTAAPPAQTQRPNDEPAAGQTPAARPRLVAPVRGTAELQYTKPVIKAALKGGKQFVVTTFQVKNVERGAIAGLKIEEFWYNKAGDIVTGSNYRHPRPLQPDEIITITLETPRNPNMDTNQYKFEHANGMLRMTLVQKL